MPPELAEDEDVVAGEMKSALVRRKENTNKHNYYDHFGSISLSPFFRIPVLHAFYN